VSTLGSHHDNRAENEAVATLVRSVPVRLVEVSRSGCRLECTRPIESGTSGQLAVELAGLLRVDDVRVARCQKRMGAGAVYQVGAELLRTRRLGRRTVRMAIRKIISGETGVGHAQNGDGMPHLGEVRTDEVSGRRSESRAPPAHPTRGP
jgi:hypothetical protein